MLETCRIRREGYSYRPRYDEFMDSFGLLAFGSKQNIEPSRATCEKVMQVSQLKGWLMGRSKVCLGFSCAQVFGGRGCLILSGGGVGFLEVLACRAAGQAIAPL